MKSGTYHRPEVLVASTEILDALPPRKKQRLFMMAFVCFAIAAALGAEAPSAKIVSISAFDTMKYSLSQIEARPGQKIVVELKNEGNIPKEVMSHNWILLKSGGDPAGYTTAATGAKAESYEPRSMADKVLAATPLVGPKETGRASFTAPSAPGAYPFFCSFPGHYAAGMKGVLIVK